MSPRKTPTGPAGSPSGPAPDPASGSTTGDTATAPAARTPRKPGLFLALLPVVTMLVLLGVGNIALGLPAEPLIIASAVVAGIVAVSLGHSYDAVLASVAGKFAKVTPAVLILLTVGLLMGAWMAGGTIPMLTYYGLQIVSPQWLPITAFVVAAVVSLCTGTSWGSVGTIGVAFMGVATGLNANMGMIAGAVVAGAYFGDKLSPLSDTTNLAAMATGVNLYKHIGHLLYTTVPSFIVTAGVMVFAGTQSHAAHVGTPKQLETINAALTSGFHFNPVLLLPVLIVLAGSIGRKPSIPVMLTSAVVAMINALVFQGISFHNTVQSIVDGFKLDMITAHGFDAHHLPESVTTLLERGGMSSMMGTLLIAFCAIAFAGVMSVTGSLNILVERLLRVVHGTGQLIAATVATGLLTIGVTSNGQISILLPGEILRDAYVKRGLHPKNLGRTIEDSASIVEPILPWTAAGAYMAGTLGVATLHYLPWAILCWTGIIFALIWGFTGVGITRLTPEEQREMLAASDHAPTAEPSRSETAAVPAS